MSDNARFHNKLHRKNHHSICTPGYPDSATDPIASQAEPFQGDFYINGNINATGALNTTFVTLSNISIPTPVLSATIGFNPTNSLIVQLSGTQYAIPVTYVGPLGTSAPAILSNSLSGNLGFGTNAPSYPIDIVGSNNGIKTSFYGTSNNLGNATYMYQSSAGSATFSNNTYEQNGSRIASLSTGGWMTISQAGQFRFHQFSGQVAGQTVTSTTPVIILSSGQVGIGTTTPNKALTVSGDISAANAIYDATGNSNNWNTTYTTVCANSASWQSSLVVDSYVISNSATFDSSYNVTVYAKLSSQPYTLTNVNSIQANIGGNNALSAYSGVLAGYYNTSSGYGSLVVGGGNNMASGYFSNVHGGVSNNALSAYSAVLAGFNNTSSGYGSLVVGGGNNTASGCGAIIAGGGNNTASGCGAIIAGGYNNVASGYLSNILGGTGNSLSGNNSFALGSNIVSTTPNYTFVNNLSSQSLVQSSSSCTGYLNVSQNSVGAALSNVRAQFTSNLNSFSQINHQNTNSGTYASTDVVVTADNGNDTQNYLDLSINSSTYSSPSYTITGPNDAYLYTQNCNIAIGTASNANILFHTGGTLASNERMRVTGSGCVGIGTSTPNNTLTVVGNISATGNAYFTNTVYCAGINQGSIQPANTTNTASNVYTLIAGGSNNIVTGAGSTVVGGYCNIVSSCCGSILGGLCNNNSGTLSIIGGGNNNITFSGYGSILGGSNNKTCCYSVVVGGYNNSAYGCYSVTGGGLGNTSSGTYSSVVGGCCNVNNGSLSFIAGGYNNTIQNGVNDAFILGSNINATCSNYTYVEGIIANNGINANCATINSIYSNVSICTYSLSAFSVNAYSTNICDSTVNRNSVIGGNLTVLGNIYSPLFSSLTGTGSFVLSGGSKYSTVFGDGVASTFIINHNLNTSDIVMTVIDFNTAQVVYPTVTINNLNQVQINFSFVPPPLSYKISIIGL